MTELFHKTNETYLLNDSAVDEISLSVQNQLTQLKYDKKNVNRIRLLIEDALLCWKEKFGDKTNCHYTVGKRFNKPYILLEVQGEQFNPFEKDNEMFGEWGQHLIDGLGFYPNFTYTSGKNRIKFEIKKPKKSSIIKIFFAVMLAIVFGFLGTLLPENIRTTINSELLERLSTVFFGLIGAVSGPLVFLSVLTGICSIGDTATLGSMGKTAVRGFVVITFLVATVSCAALPFVFGTTFGETKGSSGLTKMADMLFGMVPNNIFSPFVEGNCLQIIVLAAAFGIAMLIIGKSASGIVNIAEQLYSVTRLFMSWIGATIPFFIFVILLQNIWAGSFNALLQSWKPVVVSIAVSSVILFLFLLITSFKLHIPIGRLFKCILPSALIALTTASSMASLGEALICCENKFRIKRKYNNFALPIGFMLCKPAEMVSFTSFILYSMKIYNIELSVSSVILMIFSVSLVIIAAPPVPGGFISCYAVLFAQFGIPVSALAVVITLDVFIDFFNTSINMAIRQLAVLQQAKKLDAIEQAD